MDKKERFPIRRYTSLDAMKADEYAYWQQRPAHERMDAATKLSIEAYGSATEPGRMQKTLVRIKR